MKKSWVIWIAIALVIVFGGMVCCGLTFYFGYQYFNTFDLGEIDQPLEVVEIADGSRGDYPDLGLGSLPSASELPLYETTSCPFPGGDHPRFSCGFLYVLEDHSNPASQVIALAVAILDRENTRNNNGVPLVYLEGGPGGSALDGAAELWLNSKLTKNRDVILLDQRGTGYSRPTLNCSEYDEDYIDDFTATIACRDRLVNSGIDLSKFNSPESAADIRDLQTALGYAEIDLLGISYGTRLALTMMRYYPEGIRSVILDSVYPPNVNALDEQSLVTLQAFDHLINDCSLDFECSQAYPDLRTALLEVVDQLNNSPADVTYYDDFGDPYTELLYGDDVVSILGSSFYDTRTIPYLPAFIYALYDGNYDYALDILDIPYLNYPESQFEASDVDVSDSEGMYYSVECYEETFFNDIDRAENLVSDYSEILTFGMLYDVESIFEVCADWGAGLADSIENQGVFSAIPTLVLSGEYDPVTPPSWGALAAQSLDNSQFFVFSGYGHGIIDTGNCAIGLMLDFLDDPTSQLDAGCVGEIAAPNFVIDP